ncbi:bifunctional diaminohydroxyphosphoribosylaminopyrimidine deaminase/5-amino-6-(5-phosphoribosylamino)uracil reductase RibD [Vibrio sp. WXL210]|uniref:bifunctional diaminohydroxyphosphoribosylaminopyrimidine deaminase/5-amino-6-(5-phosphoribosylamino)uracil reductase RibD n=1 Tax=Vibrio sp. WXL210 TaxID=3450709 RepID=UPI003EC7E57A
MIPFTSLDYDMMSRAIKLAWRGRFTTAPNPNVGCVIVKDGVIVGEGYHQRAGEPHAEVHAMRAAGEKAKGATAYVTLEPCSHFGRTPPCAKGLIEAGIAKVVCAMADPNPQVGGRGFQMLQDAGVEVLVGLLEHEAEQINRAFLKRMRTGLPFVQLKMAASLDGQTALANGVSQWITGSKARRDVQRYRAQAGAILSTSQTVIADNASLNVRASELDAETLKTIEPQPLRQPLRVILDRQASLTQELKLFDAEGELLVLTAQHQALLSDGRFDLERVCRYLAKEHNINHLWVEAGATLASGFIQADLVDELIVYLAPKIMGSDGRGLFGALGLEQMSETIELDFSDVRLVGDDLRIVARPRQAGSKTA